MFRTLIIITFSLSFFNLKAQNSMDNFWERYLFKEVDLLNLNRFDSINHEKAYRIWNTYQMIEFIKINDSVYEGQLVNYVTKNSRKKKNDKIISEHLKIPNETVEYLMKIMELENIETLPDCSEIENYVEGFDGTTFIFEISIKGKGRVYSYWEPENNNYQNPEILEVKNVQTILKTIKTKIDINTLFKNFTNGLGKGSYLFGGIHMVKI